MESCTRPGRRFRFAIDRGGTFTDIYWSRGIQQGVLKLLSEDPKNYADAPREGIRRILVSEGSIDCPRDMPVPIEHIESIRMGTTVATNALLERKGARMALLVTKGFTDLLHIGNQSRPLIFDLKCARPGNLYESVVEVDERLVLVKDGEMDGIPELEGKPVVTASTGERLVIEESPDLATLESALLALRAAGITSLAVAFVHACVYGEHERAVGDVAKRLGFEQVSLSHEVMPMVKIVPRGYTACADAYLTPHINKYVASFRSGFAGGLEQGGPGATKLLFMQSDGGLAPVEAFCGHRAILSGPAGGVVGFASTTWEACGRQPVVAFDMGGTSTDVARFSGRLEHVYETTTAGVTIQAPQLDINTVAAGGGSRLFFRSGMFAVGPDSAGAHPGPVCYRKGGPLAVTDANLLLGRIVPEDFPHIFGPNEDSPLDVEATRGAFETMAQDINAFYAGAASGFGGGGEVSGAPPAPAGISDSVGAGSSSLPARPKSLDEIAAGFIAVANEAMCRPIRALTQMKGYDLTKHVLACFGGAGPQHACAMARALGVRSLFISRFSGVLSAYGISLADVVHEAQEPVTLTLVQGGFRSNGKAVTASAPTALSGLQTDEALEAALTDAAADALPAAAVRDIAIRVHALVLSSQRALEARGFDCSESGEQGKGTVEVELFVNLRFVGTDNGIMTPCSPSSTTAHGAGEIEGGLTLGSHAGCLPIRTAIGSSETEPDETTLALLIACISNAPTAFVHSYRREFGFVLRGRDIMVDDVRVRAVAREASHVENISGSTSAGTVAQARHETTTIPTLVQTRATSVYFPGLGRVSTPLYSLSTMIEGQTVAGPALLVDKTSTIVVDPGFTARIVGRGDVMMTADAPRITLGQDESGDVQQVVSATAITGHEPCDTVSPPTVVSLSGWRNNPLLAFPDPREVEAVPADPVQLSIFGHRFMGIAEQMGRTLQRTAVSVNMRERLDYSCALFGPDGGLVANAPHIPVHLGAMQDAVRFQLAYWGGDIVEGDVFVSNHPQLAGGSHLPDITVISPVFTKNAGAVGGPKRIAFFVASRGHHADIGGIAPGSMPPTSTRLAEEGAAIVAFKLVRAGAFQEEGVTDLLLAPGKQGIPGCSGSRNLRDCLSDLRAQVAANTRGIRLVSELIGEYGLSLVHAYMSHIQSAAERSVRDMLRSFAIQQAALQGHDPLSSAGRPVTVHAIDHMDDGSPIALAITIDPAQGGAHFDFSGTGPQVLGNTNAPRAVTYSAIIYSLRCLVGQDVPLNQGCLAPVRVTIPPGSLLDPDPTAAVVGGNVLTSQRVVDVIFKAFKACASSQGCMNNLTFGCGGEDGLPAFGFYETVCGGAGAGPTWHGRSGVHTHMTNTRITDPEIMERRYPVLLRAFRLRQGSGGSGLFMGGRGVERHLQFRRPLKVSILSERRSYRPPGLAGGGPGACGLNTLVKAGSWKYGEGGGLGEGSVPRRLNIGAKATVCVLPGEHLIILTPGGGGYGPSVGTGTGTGATSVLDIEEEEYTALTAASLSARVYGNDGRESVPPGAMPAEMRGRASGSLSLLAETQNDF